MRKKIVITIGVLSCIMIAFAGGRSFSKYVSEIQGNGIAQIATWNFKVNNGKEEIQTIELKSKENNTTLVDNKIAPGTEGSFDIRVDGTGSDVGIDYHIDFENETTKPSNLKFIYDNKEYNTISELEDILSGRFDANVSNKEKVYTIKWKWPYETGKTNEEKAINNKKDTDESQKISNYSFNVIVSGTQVEPQV